MGELIDDTLRDQQLEIMLLEEKLKIMTDIAIGMSSVDQDSKRFEQLNKDLMKAMYD